MGRGYLSMGKKCPDLIISEFTTREASDKYLLLLPLSILFCQQADNCSVVARSVVSLRPSFLVRIPSGARR